MSKLIQLPFGCNRGLPDDVECAWGVRAINNSGYLDYVPDRMGIAVDDSLPVGLTEQMRSQLLDYLNTTGVGTLAKNRTEHKLRGYEIDPRSEEIHVLFENEDCKIVGSPQNSGGYFYIAAWLKDHTRSQRLADLKSAQELDDADETLVTVEAPDGSRALSAYPDDGETVIRED